MIFSIFARSAIRNLNSGGSGIRTHEGLATLPIFKTGAFNHSAIPPSAYGNAIKLSRSVIAHEAKQPLLSQEIASSFTLLAMAIPP
jgi:hypothetical protein